MGDAAGQLADGFHALGLAQGALGPFAFGDLGHHAVGGLFGGGAGVPSLVQQMLDLAGAAGEHQQQDHDNGAEREGDGNQRIGALPPIQQDAALLDRDHDGQREGFQRSDGDDPGIAVDRAVHHEGAGHVVGEHFVEGGQIAVA